jgi:dethiobiotin synthetase
MTLRLFITGTDTGVGKTRLACLLARHAAAAGLRMGFYKPVCSGVGSGSGTPVLEDVERAFAALEGRFPRDRICPQTFAAPLAPPIAAALEGRTVDEETLTTGCRWWDGRVDALIVEGAGGWLSPVSQNLTNADLAVQLGGAVLVVAANRLGVINHSLLTIESVRSHGLRIAGVVLNQTQPTESPVSAAEAQNFAESNLAEIERRGGVPVLGFLPHGEKTDLVRFGQNVTVDWRELLRC